MENLTGNLAEKVSDKYYDTTSYLSRNKLIVAALVGVGAGIAIAALLSSDSGKKALHALSDTASDLTDKALSTWDNNKDSLMDVADTVIAKAKNVASKAASTVGV